MISLFGGRVNGDTQSCSDNKNSSKFSQSEEQYLKDRRDINSILQSDQMDEEEESVCSCCFTNENVPVLAVLQSRPFPKNNEEDEEECCTDIEEMMNSDYPNTELGCSLREFNSEYETEILIMKNTEKFVEGKAKELVINCREKVLESWVNDVCIQNKCMAANMEYIDEVEKKANISQTKYEQLLHEYLKVKEESLACQHRLDLIEFDNISLLKLIARIRDKGTWDICGLNFQPKTFEQIFGKNPDLPGKGVETTAMQQNIQELISEYEEKLGKMDKYMDELKNSKNDVDFALLEKQRVITILEAEVKSLSSLLNHYKTEYADFKEALHGTQNKLMEITNVTNSVSVKTREDFSNELMKRDNLVKEMLQELKALKGRLINAHEEKETCVNDSVSFKAELTNQIGAVLKTIGTDVKSAKDSIQVILEKQEQLSSMEQIKLYQEKYENAMALLNKKSELIESLQKQIFCIINDKNTSVDTESGDTVRVKNPTTDASKNPNTRPKLEIKQEKTPKENVMSNKNPMKSQDAIKNTDSTFRTENIRIQSGDMEMSLEERIDLPETSLMSESKILKRCDTFDIIPKQKSRIPVCITKRSSKYSATQRSTLNNLLEVTVKGSQQMLKENPKSSFTLQACHSRRNHHSNNPVPKAVLDNDTPKRPGILKEPSNKTTRNGVGVRFKNIPKHEKSGSSTPSEAATFKKSRANLSSCPKVPSGMILNALPQQSTNVAVKNWIESSSICVGSEEGKNEATNAKSSLSPLRSPSVESRKSLRKHRCATSSYFTRDPVFSPPNDDEVDILTATKLKAKSPQVDNFYYAPSSTIHCTQAKQSPISYS